MNELVLAVRKKILLLIALPILVEGRLVPRPHVRDSSGAVDASSSSGMSSKEA